MSKRHTNNRDSDGDDRRNRTRIDFITNSDSPKQTNLHHFPRLPTQMSIMGQSDASPDVSEIAPPTPPVKQTEEDIKFLQLANEALEKIGTIDPSIKQILTRLQYAAPPHGGVPMGSAFSASGVNSGVQNTPLVDELAINHFPNFNNDIFYDEQHLNLHSNSNNNNTKKSIPSVAGTTPTPTTATTLGDATYRKRIYEQVSPTSSLSSQSSSRVDKPFICSKCALAFRRSSDLKRHEKIHLEVLPNICSRCQKGFARKDALKRHIDTLTCKRNREKLMVKQRLQDSDSGDNGDKGVVHDIFSQFGFGK
ncbi:BA75_01689T0 [Komagataella pastoris]|uniref:BA75_01689T0 n=1 Tax=Komagataella pastoris TaxID=4922 RepID=A0A1B2J751_PICPA|nr:BA75_01689T0 [Komagataella pastoris]